MRIKNSILKQRLIIQNIFWQLYPKFSLIGELKKLAEFLFYMEKCAGCKTLSNFHDQLITTQICKNEYTKA